MKKQVLRTLFFSIAFLTGFLAKAQNDCPTWEWAFDAGVPSQVQLLESHGDTAGNMYFVGTFQSSFTIAGITLSTPDTSHFIAKYSKNQVWSWAVQFEAKLPSGFNNFPIPHDFYFDEAGFITVTGIYTHTAIFGSDTLSELHPGSFNTFVARLNTNTQQWLWATQAESQMKVEPSSIEGDANGNIYIAGSASIYPQSSSTISFGNIPLSTSGDTYYISKIDSSGTWLWARDFERSSHSPIIAVDNAQAPTVITNYVGSLTFASQTVSTTGGQYALAILGYDAAGQESWLLTAAGSNTVSGPKTWHAAYDDFGNLYITGESFIDAIQFGSTLLTGGTQLSYVAKINPQKQWAWAEYFGGASVSLAFSNFHSEAITLGNGDTYFSGIFDNDLTFGNDLLSAGNITGLFICKMDSGGNYHWGGAAYAPHGSVNGSLARPIGLGVDLQENVYISGINSDSYLFGNFSTVQYGNFVAKFKRDSIIGLSLPKDTFLYCGESIKLVPRSGSVSQLTYQWSPAHGLSDPTAQFPIASPDSTITYTLDVSTSNGCVATDQIKIVRDSVRYYGAGINFTTSTGNKMYCDNANFSISAPYTYQSFEWSTGSTIHNTYINGPGVYVLTAKDEDGCYRKDSIEIFGPSKITPEIPLLCTNDSVLLSINTNGLDSLRWNDGSSQPSRNVHQSGKYWATLYKGTCIYTDTVEVLAFTNTGNATFSARVNNLDVDFAASSIGFVQGTWRFGDGTFGSGKKISHTYVNTGVYNVCLDATDVCGVTARHCMKITVPNIGIEELPAKNIFSLFPNPATGVINIESTDEQAPEVHLTNLSGKVVLREKLAQGSHWQIDIHHLPAGYYFINIDGTVSKLVKI
ncbi:T9SS type A sorting domain-containing protein [Owenweeksia hongkongensis]|uniref:T9SS type A sorting domain-containing protein n=1 Tax=Owenweeksia hongkongensis TaxID=253245 RepID=UPI003A921A48